MALGVPRFDMPSLEDAGHVNVASHCYNCIQYFLVLEEEYMGHSWLRHYTTSWKIRGLIPDRFIGIFIDLVLLAKLWPLA
jgi:hypothetical protein